jgi:hypothetical protein
VLVGSAVEQVAFVAAGAAEGTVGITEDESSSLSDMFLKEEKKGANVTRIGTMIGELPCATDNVSQPGVTGALTMKDTNDESVIFNRNELHQTDVVPGIDEIMSIIHSWILRCMEIMAADTGGVLSLTYEMIGVFLLCFLASVVLLSSKANDTGSINTSKLLSPRRIKDDGMMRLKNITVYGRKIGPNNHPIARQQLNQQCKSGQTLVLNVLCLCLSCFCCQ